MLLSFFLDVVEFKDDKAPVYVDGGDNELVFDVVATDIHGNEEVQNVVLKVIGIGICK